MPSSSFYAESLTRKGLLTGEQILSDTEKARDNAQANAVAAAGSLSAAQIAQANAAVFASQANANAAAAAATLSSIVIEANATRAAANAASTSAALVIAQDVSAKASTATTQATIATNQAAAALQSAQNAANSATAAASFDPSAFVRLSTNNAFTGTNSFTVRPTVNGQAIWDAGNLNPSTYAPLASPAFTGTATIGGATIWHTGSLTVSAAGSDVLTSTAKVVRSSDLWSAQAFAALTWSSAITLDLSALINATVTLAGNTTLANPVNAKVGQSGVLRLVQDGTGTRTLAFGSAWKFAGGPPTASTAAGSIDAVSWIVVDTAGPVLHCTYLKAFA